jgi:hypothetical protein
MLGLSDSGGRFQPQLSKSIGNEAEYMDGSIG